MNVVNARTPNSCAMGGIASAWCSPMTMVWNAPSTCPWPMPR
jgi:hypothetical protein